MWIKVEDEYINVEMTTSVNFYRNENFYGCTIFHGGHTTKINIPTAGEVTMKSAALAKVVATLHKYIEAKC